MRCKWFIWLSNVAKASINNSDWIKDTFQDNKDFIKNYNEESDEKYFIEVNVQYLEILHERDNDFQFLPERIKIENVEKLVTNFYVIQLNMLYL